jgi:flagellar secretion chaperone FliS
MRFIYTKVSEARLTEAIKEMPSSLVVIVYDEAVASLRAAIEAIARQDVSARCEATTQTAEFVSFLRMSLDHDKGGAIAANLDRLYAFVVAQLPLLNARNDANIATGLIAVLEPLRAGWSELDARIREELARVECVPDIYHLGMPVGKEAKVARAG